jgi:MFS family permease
VWSLIKAELDYQKLFLITVVAAVLGILTFLWYSPVLLFVPEIPFPRRMGMSFWFLLYAAFVILVNAFFPPMGIHRREKRNRLLALLPISLQKLGIVRMILLALIWIGLASVFLLFLSITGDWNLFWDDPFWPVLLVSLSGAILTGSAYIAFMVDLQTLFPKEKLLLGIPQQQLFNGFIVLSTIIYFLAICYGILQSDSDFRFSVRILVPLMAFTVRSWTGATVFLLTGVGVALASIRTFTLRKSFLD